MFLKEDIHRFISSAELFLSNIRGLKCTGLRMVNFFVGHPVVWKKYSYETYLHNDQNTLHARHALDVPLFQLQQVLPHAAQLMPWYQNGRLRRCWHRKRRRYYGKEFRLSSTSATTFFFDVFLPVSLWKSLNQPSAWALAVDRTTLVHGPHNNTSRWAKYL